MLETEASGPLALAALLFAMALGPSAGAAEPRTADLLLKNGNVRTLDPRRPRAEAAAVTGNSITLVGSNAEMEGLLDDRLRLGLVREALTYCRPDRLMGQAGGQESGDRSS